MNVLGRVPVPTRKRQTSSIVNLPYRIVRKIFSARVVPFFLFAGRIEPSLDCIVLTMEMAERLHGRIDFPWHNEGTFYRRFAEGSSLYGLRKHGEWVSFGWVTTSPRFDVGELGGRIQFREPVLWIWDCVTLAGHRGKGYYPELLRGIVGREGHLLPVVFCSSNNVSSLRGIAKAGFDRAFTVRRYAVGTLIRRYAKSPSVTFFPKLAD
jgi:hypothetical protein